MGETTLRAILDHKIRVPVEDLPEAMARQIMAALSIPNLEKLNAQKQQLWGWQQMPDEIELFSFESDHLVMPRGFAGAFAEGVRASGFEIVWGDNRVWEPLERIGDEPRPLPWQAPAIETILKRHQGIYKAPAGSGKTVSILIAIQRLACQSIVIVNTKDILWQWQDRAAEFLGSDYPIGQIGDGKVEISPYITVATAQTLHRRFDELEAMGVFDQFSLVCLDECHHAQAETYNRLLDRFSARYRVGVSATPDKTGDFALAVNVLGPIIHETRPEDCTTLQKLVVVSVPTKFGFGFRPTVSRWQRSNYPQMIQALITNRERNEIIARTIMAEEGHHCLAISKRLEHLDILAAMIEDMGYAAPILRLTGSESREERQRVVEFVANEPCIVFSTLADEALDIPRLDRGFLTYPQRNAGLVTQQVGRFERVHPEKADAIIYDFCDLNVGPLENQWRTRRREVYKPRGYQIVTKRPEEFDAARIF